MGNILKDEKPPFVLAILIAALSWTITHIVTRTLDKPIIEFKSEIENKKIDNLKLCTENLSGENVSSEMHTFTIRNISKDKLFKGLYFQVISLKGNILGVKITARSPATSGNKPYSCTNEIGMFPGMVFHPGWEFIINVKADEHSELSFNVASENEAVNLMECNIETWLVRNESAVLLWAILTFILLGITYIFKLQRS